MSYKIGQFIGLKDNSYMSLLDDGEENKSYLNPKLYTTSSQFSNSAVSFEDSGFYLNTSLERGEGYLFVVEIEKKANDIQDFTIKLRNKDNIEMIIGAYRVEESSIGDTTQELKIIIIPEINDSSDIIFELQRTASDYSQISSRTVSIVNYKLYHINNKLANLSDFNTRTNLIKGMTIEKIDDNLDLSFIITGEEIKIGSDNFFELHEEMNLSISYLGFLIEPEETEANTPYFILNYKYE